MDRYSLTLYIGGGLFLLGVIWTIVGIFVIAYTEDSDEH